MAQWMSGEDLSDRDCESLLDQMMSKQISDVKLAALLTALQIKGASGSELAGFARALRHAALEISTSVPNLVDTCGTGGGIPSFNISTAAAIVAAAAGAKVAKHGNRAVTSTCGSADVLEELGVDFTLDRERLAHVLETVGLVFLFAPSHHPALAAVGPVRRELGIRTVFNQLGPLANPAGATRQVIGTFDPRHLAPMAEATAQLGLERALIVHGADGLDEVSPCAPTHAVLLSDGRIELVTIDENSLGVRFGNTEAIAPGETLSDNAAILREAVSDPESPRSAAIWPSAGAALWIGGVAASLADGVDLARQAIAKGLAADKLQALIEVTAGE
jgi:anthranilate phosphoribosyltransferase